VVSWERDHGIALREIDPGPCPVPGCHGTCRASDSFDGDSKTKPAERKVGAKRPKITHLPKALENRTRRERQAEKEAVAAERRAIKKAARRHLKRRLLQELEDVE